jgi:GNAT superfamily N-acetyltransferase
MELTREDGLLLSDDRTRVDLARVRRWLAESYWANDRSPETIERSVANSRVYGVYTPDGLQVALTRATTDLASFAWIGDVVVDADWRGRGIGTWLVGSVVEHLRELGVPRFVLATRDAHGVYANLGFTALRIPGTWMEIDDRPTRPEPGDVRLPPTPV